MLSGSIYLEERGVLCAAAEAFKAHTAGAGEAVVYAGIGDQRRDDVEEGLLHAIGDRPRGVPGGGQEGAAAEFARNDAHLLKSSGMDAGVARIAPRVVLQAFIRAHWLSQVW